MNIVNTKDGSFTLFAEDVQQHYHSVNGALSESMHVFINLGLNNFNNQTINILELGYGTGLNAILSYKQNLVLNNMIFYHAIDVNPISKDVFNKLQYNYLTGISNLSPFVDNWNIVVKISKNFQLYKQTENLLFFTPKLKYDLIFFDAFSPDVQPEMWTCDVFSKLYESLNHGGILTTYSSKGLVKNNLKAVGFVVKRMQGPKGKRHVIFAKKNN